MSIPLNNNSKMGSPSFQEFRRQASFFFKEKIKTARLALTDATPAELMTEEFTDGSAWPPDTSTMGVISRAAFEVDDYWRIMEILHNRLLKFDRKNWRVSYKALILLEHLVTQGPQSAAEEFQSNQDVIKKMENFQYIDEKGFNWGLSVRKLSKRVLNLLENESFLKEKRASARKLTRGIEGFGSFCQRSTLDGRLRNSSFKPYGRSNSHYNDQHDNGNEFFASNKGFAIEEGMSEAQETHENNNLIPKEPEKNSSSWVSSGDEYTIEGDHPFCENEQQTTASLLSAVR